MLKKTNFIVLGIFILLFTLTACKKNSTDTGDEDQTPVLPPQNTLTMDFSEFSSAPLAKKASDVTTSNWAHAAEIITIWGTMVNLPLVLPTTAYAYLLTQEPVKEENGSWKWTKNFTLDMQKFTADLYCSKGLAGWNWEFDLTEEQVYENFKWFTGKSLFNGSAGSWNFYYDPTTPKGFIEVKWAIDKKDSTFKITYILKDSSNESLGAGSFIEFETLTDTTYNAHFVVYTKSNDQTVEIYWNRQTRAGRIKDPVYYEDTNWRCWDEYRQDINCN